MQGAKSGCVGGMDGRFEWGSCKELVGGASGVGLSFQASTFLSTFWWKQGRSRLVLCLFVQHSSVTGEIKAASETY